MRTAYLRELSFHTPESFGRALHVDADEALRYIELLCAHGVLKLRTGNEGKEYDASYDVNVHGSYQLVYVGLVLVDDLCIVAYPKYLPGASPGNPGTDTLLVMRQVFRVLRKIEGSYSGIAAVSEEGMRANDRLALMLMLLEHYGEYGVYSNYVRTLADNGPGDISWERTIASNLPFMSRERPVYMDYKTVESDRDAADFVTRLHRAVLTECSRFMQESGLASLLTLDEVWLSDAKVEDFGDADLVSYRLERERGLQFVTWKQEIIDLLLRYVGEDDSTVRKDAPLCLGTSSFYHVWEETCKVAFDDALDKRLCDFDLELVAPFDRMGTAKLIDIIPRPQWTIPSVGGEEGCSEVATLIPDAVSLRHNGDGGNVFAILDAKYYTPKLGTNVRGVPGVESVTKQFLYQAAYRDFVLAHGYSRVINAFLVPSAGDVIEHVGRVRFPGVIAAEEEPFSNVVELYSLPARRVFEAYLAGESLDNDELLVITGGPNVLE
ncbi:LlaJI family restriction endonuclease [Caniella muris]|uniref:LlaJI family restriction endonuclease n=1 Tax=Caniella muris TaxID=2941502 RepID=UPI00203B4A87|nr:LlaJI family restriction endonuclease [Caniella muris]